MPHAAGRCSHDHCRASPGRHTGEATFNCRHATGAGDPATADYASAGHD